jgi:hypothetical protein
MSHYTFTQTFHTLYDKAALLYDNGRQGASTYFTQKETDWLIANGLTAQHLYDYAEDRHKYGEPDYGTALAIELIRRDYFLNVQDGRSSLHRLDESSLPPKTLAVRGIEWLPRLIPKARAKLRGELPESLMYGCGGDRKFFKAHDIHPAEFLSLVWRYPVEDEIIIDWVVRRSSAPVL